MEEEIIALRKALVEEESVDAGAATIHYHLQVRYRRRKKAVPSVATIWRVLSRRGFITPQPHKRPRSAWRRFRAELPNECWQADTTHGRRHRRGGRATSPVIPMAVAATTGPTPKILVVEVLDA